MATNSVKPAKCRYCRELIEFVHRSGFIPKGQPKYYPVNASDQRPHQVSCKINRDLKAARKAAKDEKSQSVQKPQTEMFK